MTDVFISHMYWVLLVYVFMPGGGMCLLVLAVPALEMQKLGPACKITNREAAVSFLY